MGTRNQVIKETKRRRNGEVNKNECEQLQVKSRQIQIKNYWKVKKGLECPSCKQTRFVELD